MKRIQLTWIATVSALVAGVLAPLSANAVATTSFVTTPATSTNLNLDDSVDVQTTLALPANSTLDSTMQQVWPDGAAKLGTVQSPTGWSLQYKVGSTWQNNRPADATTISGVRANISGLQTGPGTANGLQATASASSTVIVADASSINASGRGDGWDVFLSPLYILNVYHHDANYKLECHERATGNLCGSLYQVNGYATSSGSSGSYYRGKIYSYVVNGGQAKVICTNVTALPFTPCGTFTVGAAATSATGNLGTQAFDGTRVWAANSNTNSLMCFDVTTETACGPYALSGFSRSAASLAAFTTYIGGKIFTISNKIFCTEPSTGASCGGSWPVAVTNAGPQANVIPKRTNTGVVNGVCTITVDYVCFDMTGASAAMPANLTTMLTTPSSAVHGGSSYFQTTAWTTTRQYWATNATGADWSTGRAACFDWTTQAACAGFATNVDLGASRYAFTIDTSNINCVWTNGDTGTISNFDANTGQAGCPVTTTKAAVDFAGLPKYSCNTATGVIRTFDSLAVTLPQGSTFNRNNLVVSVLNGAGEPVAGFQSVPLVNGSISLAGLQVASTSTEFRFVIESVNATNFPLSTQDAGAISATLVYEADPVQLCVNLVAIMPICPASLTGLTTVTQPDFAVVQTATYTVSGQAAVVQTNTATYHVNPITPAACYIWRGFLNSAGQGVDTGGSPSLVDTIVFGPDNKMYVGGIFTNSGGNANADYLAVWDGTAWSPVGEVPILSNGQPVLDQQGNPTFGPALNGRVNSIAWWGNKLVIGGSFTDAGGVAAADYLAMYDPIAKVWSAPISGLTGSVNSIAISATGIAYLGGAFSGKVTAVNLATSTVQTLATLNGNVNTVALDATGNVYVGGAFTGYIKKWDATSSSWVNVSTDANQSNFLTGAVNDIAIKAGKVYVVGLFNGVAVLDLTADTWSWLGGSAEPAGDGRSVAVAANGDVYVAGSFATANSVNAINVTKYNGTAWIGFRDARTLSMAMDVAGAVGPWAGAWEVTLSPNGVAIWGGDMQNCATRSELDFLCYFGDNIVVSPTALTNTVQIPTYDGPMVTWQSTYNEKVEGGTQLIIRGRLIKNTNKVLIGGKEAKIVSASNTEVVVIMPANPEGPQQLVLSLSDNKLVYYATIKYAAVAVQTPAKRPPVTVTIGGFADGSPVLSTRIKSSINAFLKKYSDYKNIECVGYTEGPTVLKSDYKLSKQRAVNSCNFALAGLAKGMHVIGMGSGQNLKEAASVRRVVITLTD